MPRAKHGKSRRWVAGRSLRGGISLRGPCPGGYSPADSAPFPGASLGGCFLEVYTDRTISCLDCGQEFSFTAGEQEFYAQRGFSEPPKRCPSCRAIRKAQRTRATSSFEGGGDAGGWRAPAYAGSPAGYSSRDGGYGERRPREMFEAVCADCGKTASVPFRPSGSKPVYCSDCFQNRR